MAYPDKRHPVYNHIDTKKNESEQNGVQPGDPVKGAKAMYHLANVKDTPVTLRHSSLLCY